MTPTPEKLFDMSDTSDVSDLVEMKARKILAEAYEEVGFPAFAKQARFGKRDPEIKAVKRALLIDPKSIGEGEG